MDYNGCKHYQRKCSLLAPCCGKEYKCRLCHDDVEDHSLDRKKVENIVCHQCRKQQKIQTHCEECGILFGRYTCLICRLFDDVDKQQFHCGDCGICRVGGREKFFHCRKCGLCLNIEIKETHKCLENISQNNCPVCLEDLHTSRKSAHVPNCGHLIHQKCLEDMLKHGQACCPVCNTSLMDMTSYWEKLDKVIAETQMPTIYREYHVNILCRDCHKESRVLFHIIGLKCQSCAGFNTTRIGGDDPLPEEALSTVAELSVSSDREDSWETISNDNDEEGHVVLDEEEVTNADDRQTTDQYTEQVRENENET